MKYFRFLYSSSIISLFLISSMPTAGAQEVVRQESIRIVYSADTSYRLVERSDLSRYLNDAYTGLTQREVRAFIEPQMIEGGMQYDGSFFVLEDTYRNNVSSAAGVSDMIESVFVIAPDGTLTMKIDNGYPSLRSFPSYPSQALKPGDSWQAPAVRAVDPLNKGLVTRMNILVQYTFVGSETYKGIPVFRVRAKWATRYRDKDRYGDPNLKDATGTHNADIIISVASGAAILIRDTLDETFFYADGTKVRFRGSTLLFTEIPPALERSTLIPALQRIASVENAVIESPSTTSLESCGIGTKEDVGNLNKGITQFSENVQNTNGMLVEETKAGIRLSVRDIRFVADSDEILADESWRLDEIARVLKLVPNAQFLIEGHTASVGNPSGEKTLSMQRAKCIAQELSTRGISIERFLYAGWGGEKPATSNDTEAGRAQNRRVEITILQ